VAKLVEDAAGVWDVAVLPAIQRRGVLVAPPHGDVDPTDRSSVPKCALSAQGPHGRARPSDFVLRQAAGVARAPSSSGAACAPRLEQPVQ
jgi:hypothetical protein